ncbi:MAG: hypothetical protein Tsb0026_18150 [Sulfuricaulis sp.]
MLNFTVIEASLTEEFGGTVDFLDEIEPGPKKPVTEPRSKSRLTLRVRIADDQTVWLAEGERLDKLPGTIAIYPHTGDLQKDRKGIGAMSYSPHKPADSAIPAIPARYSIRVILPQSQFDPLIAAACFGRIPSRITITVRGLQLADETNQSWDTRSSPVLYVASISFSIPLAIEGANQEKEESVHKSFPSPIQSQIHRLRTGLSLLRPKM